MAENFALMRQIVERSLNTQFQENWQFLVEIDGMEDFSLYVKDITFGPVEIETDQKKTGGGYLTFPTGAAPVGISMTMRDNQDRRIYTAFSNWAGKIVNQDGTLNPPMHPQHGYLKKWNRIQVLQEPPGVSGGYSNSAKNYIASRLSAELGVNVRDPFRKEAGGKFTKVDTDSWWVYPTQIGDITESYGETGFLEYPITLIQFRSLGQSA